MNKSLVHTVLFIVAMIYGANYSIAKLIVPSLIGPFATIIFRVIIAGILFWVIHFFWVKEKVTSRKDFIRLAFCGLFGVASNQLLFFKGLSITTPINASLMMLTTPVLVFILSYIFLNERLTINKILGLLLSGLGASLLVGGKDFSFNSTTALGDLFILLNAISYGTYLILAKPLMNKYDPLTITKWTFFFGSFIVVPFGFHEFLALESQNLPPKFYYCLAYIIIGTTFLAYLLNAWGLKFVNASVVGAYIYLQPVFAPIFAYIILGNSIDINTIFFGLIIFAGVYLVSKKPKKMGKT